MKKLILLALISLSFLASADEVNKMATIDDELSQKASEDSDLAPYFYTTFNSSNIINYKIIRIPVNNFVPNLNNFISHSTDLLYTNQKMISDLNDYIFNKSFILLNNIASFDSINDPKTVLNASLIYLYNINFKLCPNSIILLNDIQVDFLLPLSTEQFFIKTDPYYKLDINYKELLFRVFKISFKLLLNFLSK